jgi:hypothetical protein
MKMLEGVLSDIDDGRPLRSEDAKKALGVLIRDAIDRYYEGLD